MKILFITHTDFEIPTYIVSWAQEKNFEILYCRPFRNEVLPQVSEFDCLILMGGTQCLLELDRYPFLNDEISLVENAISADKIVLGFCLGAQIIGKAHGIKTEKSPHEEIGVFPITLTPDGQNDPLLMNLPTTFLVTHWHKYMPGVPKDAKILAISEGCPRQIIRYSSKVYGFQCHPEVTFEDIQKAISFFEKDLYEGTYIQSKDDFLKNDFSSINNKMILILNNLVHKFL